MAMRMIDAGSEVVGLLPVHVKSWWPLLEDIYYSPAVAALTRNLIDLYIAHEEFQCLSVDATLRVCLRLMGQASYRSSRADRAQAAFNDEASKRRILTARGRSRTAADLSVVGAWTRLHVQS